jgi:hypothetical protein
MGTAVVLHYRDNYWAQVPRGARCGVAVLLIVPLGEEMQL